MNFVNDGRGEELDDAADIIQEAINMNNKVLAGNLIRQFEIPML